MKGLEQQMIELFSDENRLQIWLDIEAALARCQAKLGILPQNVADDICAKAQLNNIDLDEYRRLYIETKHPLVPLLKLFQKAVGPSGEFVHFGATTHDIVDIGKMISLKKVWDITEETLLAIEDDLLDLIEKHAYTLMAGRSHNIQALPITFGFKAAIWASELRRDIERLQQARDRVFVVTFSGANGTMASFDGKGHELEALMAKEFELGVPDISWHAARDRIAEIASIFAIIGGTLARIAQEVYLLMASEIGELSEGYTESLVGSSTMPHKINPINTQHIMGAARTLRYDAAHCIECMLIDHEHNLVHFNDERLTVERMGRTMGELLERSYELVHTLHVDEKRMRKNLDVLKGAVQSENVMLKLGERIGKMTAKNIVTELAVKAIREDAFLSDLLNNDPRVSEHLSSDDISKLLDPVQYADAAAEIALDYVNKTRSIKR
jgi:adenylosuccinate lyase